MSRAMMKLFPSHSPGGMLTLSNEECSPSTLDSWYHASWAGGHGQVGEDEAPSGHLEAPPLAVRAGW
jgi:hypothetical protein